MIQTRTLHRLPSIARIAGLATLVLALFWLALAFPAGAQDIRFPPLTGRVVDNAELIPAPAEAALTARLEALEQATTDQVVVVTLPDLQGREIEDYGYRLGRAWGIGRDDKDNGLLLIVAPNDRKVRIEVGRGLEPVMTDALSTLIIQNDILPAFRDGDFAGGIERGVDAIERQLRLDPTEAQAVAQAAAEQESGAPVSAIFFILIVFAFLFFSFLGAVTRGGRRRRGSGLANATLWAISEAMRDSGRGGDGGSWGGGGGFSGGGGGFGGGGASGGW